MRRRLGWLLALPLACSPSGPSLADPLVLKEWERVIEIAPPHTGAALALDVPRRTAYLFGGVEMSSGLADHLWRTDVSASSTHWQRIPTTAGPSARFYSHAWFDQAADRVIILGGDDQKSAQYSDVWAWDRSGNSWTQISTAHPGPAVIHQRSGMVFDSRRNRLLYLETSSSGSIARTWALSLDGTPDWSLVATTFEPVYPGRCVAAFDSLGDRVFALSEQSRALRALDLATGTWSVAISDIAAPIGDSPRRILWWDGSTNRLITTLLSDWAISGGIGRLDVVDLGTVPLAWSTTRPSVYGPHILAELRPYAFDPVSRQVLLENASSGVAPRLFRLVPDMPGDDVTWVVSTDDARPTAETQRPNAADTRNRWWYIRDGAVIHRAHLDELGRFERVHPAGEGPTPRNGQGAVWDSIASRLLFCGGTDSAGTAVGDVWELALTDPPQWRFIVGSGLPIGPSVAIDPVRRFLYATTRISTLSQLWRLDLDALAPVWTLQSSDVPITPRALAYDAIGNRLLALENSQGTTVDLDAVPPVATAPAPRPGGTVPDAAIAFDSKRGRMYMHKGAYLFSNTGVHYRHETDAFGADGDSVFSDPGVTGEATLPDFGGIATYDPVRDRVLLLNGREFTCCFSGAYPFSISFFGLWILHFDPATPTRLDLVDAIADAGGDAIRVRFSGEGPSGEVRVERASGDASIDDWSDLGAAVESTPGLYEFTDALVVRGVAYRYRGRWMTHGVEHVTAASEPVMLGSLATGIALHARDGSVLRRGPMVFACRLPAAGNGVLELVDVRGRIVARTTFQAGAGRSVDVTLDAGQMAGPGLYFARLRQGVATAGVRVVRV